jgi:hypothetical protein
VRPSCKQLREATIFESRGAAYPPARAAYLYWDRGILLCKLGRYDECLKDANEAGQSTKGISDKTAAARLGDLCRNLRGYALGGQGHFALALNDLQNRTATGDFAENIDNRFLL